MFTCFYFLVSLSFQASAVCTGTDQNLNCAKPDEGQSSIVISNFDEDIYCNCDFTGISISLSSALKVIPDYAFHNSKITSLSLPAGCNFDSIGASAFEDCSELTIQGEIKAHFIGNSAFKGCSLLNSKITITNKVNSRSSVGSYAFQGCTSLVNTLTINEANDPQYYPTIGDFAFQNSGIKTLDLPHMESIGKQAFEGCEKLTGSSGKDLIVDTIKEKAFYLDYLVNFKNIVSNDIGSNAFTGCIALNPEKIQIVQNKDAKYVGGNIKKEAFMNCKAFKGTLEILAPENPVDPNDEIKYTTISNSAFKNSGIMILDFKCLIEKIDTSAFENCASLGTNTNINVKTIESKAFYNDANLQLDKITAELIKENAFNQCYKLKANIEINDKYYGDEIEKQLIGNNAFEDCYSLGTLHFNTDYIDDRNEAEERTIGNYAFLNSGLQGPLTLPNTITSIGTEAFSFCSNIGQVTFENKYLNELTISNKAFYHSGANSELVIPNTVTSIGKSAFAYTQITTLTIQGSVIIANPEATTLSIKPTDISDEAFYYCKKLKTLIFGEDSIKLDQSDKEITSCKTFRGCPLKEVNLGSLSTIPAETFYGMTELNFLKPIPDSLTTINERAFAECSQLKQFKFSDNSQLSSIKAGAFYKTGLTSFSFPFHVTGNVEPYTFYQCTDLGKVEFNNNIKQIQQYAFYGCTNLKGPLDLSNQLTSIGTSAFQNCYSLDQSLTIPDTVTTIGEKAFMGCQSFTGHLTIGRSITTINKFAFRDCSGFDGKLIFPDYFQAKSTPTIEEGAFYGCSGFTGDLIIPQESATEEGSEVLKPILGKSVFRGCSGFDGILHLPNTVTSIDEYAFYGCTNLCGDISLMKLSEVGKYAFYGCSHLTGSVDLEDMGSSDDEGGAPGGPGGDDEDAGPDVTINEYAFCGCSGLDGQLILPTDLTIEVKEHAFDGCSNLKGTLDGFLFTKIKKYGFAKCSSLTGQLNFGEDTTEIQEYAFLDCSGFSEQLSFIVNDVEDNGLVIGHCAFKGCSGFKKGRLSFNINAKEEKQDKNARLADFYRYNYFLKIGNEAFDGTKFKNVYYMGRFEPDCDYDIGISKIKGIHTSSNYANKTFCNNPIHKSKLSGGAIAGIVIACIVVVAVIVFLIVFFILRNKKNKDASEAEVEMNQDP